MEHTAHEPTAALPSSTIHPCTPPTRHDGWTGERMAAFLATLADTGLVTEACRVAGMSREGAYSLRNRDGVFDAAWRAALTKARPHVADGLLERSITGTVEHYYRDGVLVGERRHYESWLALAVLRRLDKQAEEDRADATLSARMADDWQATLDALTNGGTQALPELLEAEVDKVDTPPSPEPAPMEREVWGTCWRNQEREWRTDFPPPPGFEGYESGDFLGDDPYERACTSEESELLDVNEAAGQAEEYDYCATLRDDWFEVRRAYHAASPSRQSMSPAQPAT